MVLLPSHFYYKGDKRHMQYLFYDTCALLDASKLEEKFYISSITLKELEYIKSSAQKDQEIKFKARRVIRWLEANEDNFTVIEYKSIWDDNLRTCPILSDNNDSRIILTALQLQQEKMESVIFITHDYFCKRIAAAAGLQVRYEDESEDLYRGWAEVKTESDDELANIYNIIYDKETLNPFNLLYNQYLLIKDKDNEIIDYYKFNGEEYVRVPNFYCFDSEQFGKIKPKDSYQLIAMDSLVNNKITVVRGPAGSGKSYLSIAYLFNQLEKGHIDKIVIFCNPVAANGAARLGFYPGSRTEKLLDSQIGNFLIAKIGDRLELERLIDKGTVVLLPLADVRGFDTTGMRAGVYITEAQNMDIELMRLALQRIGDDCICILDGDIEAQVDLSLYSGNNNGLRRVSQVFRGQDLYGEVELPNIYRSRIAELAQQL